MDKSVKPKIVISAINFTTGGPLSVLQDCLSFLQKFFAEDYQIIALVHDKNLFKNAGCIEFIEFPKSVNSYIYRFYYEYYYFNQLSKKINPYLWLSLHDMTPRVHAEIRAVYCHNPSPFYKLSFREIFFDPTFTLFNIFYRYIYKINIKKNDYVIVQQDWLRNEFRRLYQPKSVIVAYPDITVLKTKQEVQQGRYQFFFPTLPRFFKNIEVIVDAVKILNKQQYKDFNVVITISGVENKYSRFILKYSSGIENINFVGRLSREKVFKLYEQSDCLIYPSKLETWGLPITEFKQFKKPMLAADLPYAHETVGDYHKVNFFKPDDASELANQMSNLINKKPKFIGNKSTNVDTPFAQNWPELFDVLLKRQTK